MQNELKPIVAKVATAIVEMNADWEAGRATSPSQLDYVLAADRILTRDHPGYIGSTDEGRDFLADVIYEDAGETWITEEDIAREIVTQLTAE